MTDDERRRLDMLTDRVIWCVIKVHQKLGPGFLESIYRKALAYELTTQGLRVEEEKELFVAYKDLQIPGQRFDLKVEGRVLAELKCVDDFAPIHQAVLLSYLKTAGLRLGLLINFKTTRLKDGLRRVVR